MSRPPSEPITSTDHGGYVIIAGAVLLSWMLLALVVRVVLRLRVNGPWCKDDTVMAIGSVGAGLVKYLN